MAKRARRQLYPKDLTTSSEKQIALALLFLIGLIIPHACMHCMKDVDMNNVGITFDFGHAYVSAGYYQFDFLKAVKETLPYVIHAHVHDNFCRFNPLSPHDTNHDLSCGYGDLHLPIGWGSIPYRDVFGLVKRTYDGIYVLEPRPRYREHFQHTIAKLRKFLG